MVRRHEDDALTEESPLLHSSAEVVGENDPSQSVETGQSQNGGAAQSVTVVRGFLISTSLFVLIFLQGHCDVRGCALIISVNVLPTVLLQEASNFSLITTTQSAIAHDLDAFAQASWFTSAYLIAMSSITPLTGRLSQMFSPRNCIFGAGLIFSFGTLLTGLSPALSTFLLGRALTGVGAAGFLPISIVLILELTGKKRRGLYIGLINTGYTVGVALGAVIGGALEPAVGWRPIFWIQTPIVFCIALSIFFSIPKSFTSANGGDKRTLGSKLRSIDYLGIVTLTSGLVLLLLALSLPKVPVSLVVLSLVLFATFGLIEVRFATHPVIPVTVLQSRGALLTCLSTLGFMAARWTVLFYTPVYAISIRNWLPATAGSMLIPTNAGFAFGGLAIGFIHIRRAGSFYVGCLVTYALFPITLFTLGQLSTEHSAAWAFIIATTINGFFAGAALNYTLAHLLHLSLPETQFIVTSLLAAFRGFAGSFGSAIGGGIFTRVLQHTLEAGFEQKGLRGRNELVRQLIGSPALVRSLSGDERQVAVFGYVTAFKALFTAASGVAALMLIVQAGTGWRAPTKERIENGDDSLYRVLSEHHT